MSQATKTVRMDAIDEICRLQRCFSSVADLMNPEPDLHAVNRENLAVLMDYLSDRLAEAAEGAEGA